MVERTGPLKLRMPEAIKDWLYLSAKQNSRSVSREIMFRLRESLGNEYSKNAVGRFIEHCPTGLNDDGIGIRFDTDLKETLRNHAKISGNSLNQEMVMRLFYSKESDGFSVGESTAEYSAEDTSLIKIFNTLNEQNKKAVVDLIRNLSE